MRILFALILFLSFYSAYAQEPSIIPKPVSVQIKEGSFTITPKTVLAVHDEEDKKGARFLNEYLMQVYGFQLPTGKEADKDYIRLATRKFIRAPSKESYDLTVSKEGVTIEGDSYAAGFYGVQTLIQLLPVHNQKTETANRKLSIPLLSINDYPRFSYRGLHLDVGRHLFPLSFIKKYIDYIALHKMNYFHWHLTEDQGWRIQINRYPKLTERGAYRNGTIVGRYPGTANDNIRYGGFYTQEEVKEVVQYAADRHITVVPEIEMPGHSSAAIAAYPWLSCFPEKPTKIPGLVSQASTQAGGKLVQETWGVFEDVYCAGNDSTFLFLQGVLDEVLTLFPSRYIHVGGDESPKAHWRKCPRCQKRIKDEGLKDEHGLQSYFIQRMERYLNSKGRILIGWDEILEGGLAPNAVVMSWRGEKGGMEAAKQEHAVIMTPSNPVYFDYTQSTHEDSVTIGGYNPIEKVYAYDPVPKELSAQQAKFILGAQANLWTEYIKYPSKVEYMIFPRLSALSEVLWSQPDKKDWNDFEKRMSTAFTRYDLLGANYSRAYYDLKMSLMPSSDNKGLLVKLETKDKGGKLSYGIKGRHFQKNYTAPVAIRESGQVTGMYKAQNGMVDSMTLDLRFNKATAKKITLREEPSRSYPGDGAFTLVNGIQNERGLARGREFIGYNGTDLEAIIDLGRAEQISKVVLHTLHQEGSWIYHPQSCEVLGSADGQNFKPLGISEQFKPTKNMNGIMEVSFNPVATRLVKVVVKNYGVIPEGKPGAGNKAWLFADEIDIN